MLIKEVFLSLQGEGREAGLPTIFIRTGKCNLRCNYCDTNFDNGKELSVEEVIKMVK
jgi:organic radical activating enzyme